MATLNSVMLALSILGLCIIQFIAVVIYRMPPITVKDVQGYLMIPKKNIMLHRVAEVTPNGGLTFHNGHPGVTVFGATMGGEIRTMPINGLKQFGSACGTLVFFKA